MIPTLPSYHKSSSLFGFPARAVSSNNTKESCPCIRLGFPPPPQNTRHTSPDSVSALCPPPRAPLAISVSECLPSRVIIKSRTLCIKSPLPAPLSLSPNRVVAAAAAVVSHATHIAASRATFFFFFLFLVHSTLDYRFQKQLNEPVPPAPSTRVLCVPCANLSTDGCGVLSPSAALTAPVR